MLFRSSMYAALKTPAPLIKRLSSDILSVMASQDMRERLLVYGATPLPGTPDDLRAKLAKEVPAWRKVVQEAGIRAD